MTIKKMIDRYTELLKNGYETITIHEVLRDLKGCQRIRKPKVNQNNCGHLFKDDGIVIRCSKCKMTMGEAMHAGHLDE